MECREIELDAIIMDAGTQTRASLDEKTADEYADIIRNGTDLPPARVFHDGSRYILSRGFHRILAARRAGMLAFRCEVLHGGIREAILDGVGSNAEHGLRRTNADKRREVGLLLDDPEWAKWSDRELAMRAKVSNQFVSNMRNERLATFDNCPAIVNGGQLLDNCKTPQINERRIGRDGKSRPATKNSTAEPKEKEPSTPRAKDSAGVDVPDRLAGNFLKLRDEFLAAIDSLSKVRRWFIFHAQQPEGYLLKAFLSTKNNSQPTEKRLDELLSNLKMAAPTNVCPYCKGEQRKKACEACKGFGIVSKLTYESFPGVKGAKKS